MFFDRRRSVGRSVGRSVVRSFGRSVGRSVGRSFGRSFGRSVGRSKSRLPVGLDQATERISVMVSHYVLCLFPFLCAVECRTIIAMRALVFRSSHRITRNTLPSSRTIKKRTFIHTIHHRTVLSSPNENAQTLSPVKLLESNLVF